MKKAIFIAAIFIAATSQAQEKKDTTIQVKMSINDFRVILGSIDQNIDSKKLSNGLIDFLQKNASIVADKPKTEAVLPTKKKD